MRNNFRIAAIIILAVMSAAAAVRAGAGPAPKPERSLDIEVKSEILGETVPVRVYLPDGYYQSGRRYPVFYILEGGLYFRAMTGTIDALSRIGSAPEMIVVDIGTTDRWRDFTPTRAGIPGRDVMPTSGGGLKHAGFLEKELIPRIDGEFRTQPFRALYGHSIAALHVITVAFEKPDLFGACIATSPSLWWDGEAATAAADKALGSGRGFRGSLFLAIGGEDETMQAPLRRFCSILSEASANGPRWELKTFPGSTHPEVPLAAFSPALDFIFDGWVLPDSVAGMGLEAVDAHYQDLSKRYGYRVEAPEGVMNRLGYIAMNNGDIEAAISIFERNVRAYPGSANVYDSLGEALLARGDKEQALARYRKALELDPENRRIQETVEKLEKEI